MAINPKINSEADMNTALIRFITICILTLVCLLHYFSGKFGLFMNRLLAIFKLVLLVVVTIAGLITPGGEGSGRNDFQKVHEGKSGEEGLSAMVLILYTYQGWENANYVRNQALFPA